MIDPAGEETLKAIYTIPDADKEVDWWNDLSDAAKHSVENGLHDAEQGRTTPRKTAMEKYEQWLS